jgi:hypothetical protein
VISAKKPEIYAKLVEIGEKICPFKFTTIHVNKNVVAPRHKDSLVNRSPSVIVSFGDYTGGELNILEGDLSGNHNICHNPIITDFSKVLHSVSNFTGHRYSLVYYTLKKEVNLPPPSVRFENNKYYFYRGGEKITRAKGLPHPLRKIKPSKETKLSGIIKEVKNLTLTFD